jgi:hypothetical protein
MVDQWERASYDLNAAQPSMCGSHDSSLPPANNMPYRTPVRPESRQLKKTQAQIIWLMSIWTGRAK